MAWRHVSSRAPVPSGSSASWNNPVSLAGLLKVGLPAAKEGLSEKDPTLADLLKPLGYAAGQFGKNHLGDRNEFLPTVHGFDEFFINLYHLNAENEPENPDYPKPSEYPNFANRYEVPARAATTSSVQRYAGRDDGRHCCHCSLLTIPRGT
jgi:arylsulfatase A-like enzyme